MTSPVSVRENESTTFRISIQLIAVLFLAVMLRLTVFNSAPFFMDTAYYSSLGLAVLDGDWLQQIDSQGDKPPVFFYIQAIFFLLFGRSDAVALLPSFVGGMIGVWAVFLLGKQLHEERTGIYAAFLFAISPAGVMLSTEAYIDSLFVAVMLFSLWALAKSRILVSGLLAGFAFGLKQTILALFPLYTIWILTLALFQYREQWLKKTILGNLRFYGGMAIWILPIFYWNVFISSNRLQTFSYILGFIQTPQNTDFEGTPASRWSMMQNGLEWFIGLEWGCLAFMVGIALVLLGIQLRKGVTRLSSLLHVELIGFCVFFLLLVLFVAKKYSGVVSYLLPVVPLVCLSAAFAFSEVVGFMVNKRYSTLLVQSFSFILAIFFLNESIPFVREVSASRRNAPHQGIRSFAQILKPRLPNAHLYVREQGWMLRYYLYGVEYSGYTTYDLNALDEVKNQVIQQPYREHLFLFYPRTRGDLKTLTQALRPDYDIRLEAASDNGNFELYRLYPVAAGDRSKTVAWNKEWSEWWKKRVQKKWQTDSITEIHWDGNRVELVANNVPFGETGADEVHVTVENPTLDPDKSRFYGWPYFTGPSDVRASFKVNPKGLTRRIVERYPQIDSARVGFIQDRLSLSASGQVQNSELSIKAIIRYELIEDFIRSHIEQLEINGWKWTWLAKQFHNDIIPRVRIGYRGDLGVNLKKIKQVGNTLVFLYEP